MTALSWQPPPVTKCGECPVASHIYRQCEYDWNVRFIAQSSTNYSQNKDGITESCPAWQQQNKDKK